MVKVAWKTFRTGIKTPTTSVVGVGHYLIYPLAVVAILANFSAYLKSTKDRYLLNIRMVVAGEKSLFKPCYFFANSAPTQFI